MPNTKPKLRELSLTKALVSTYLLLSPIEKRKAVGIIAFSFLGGAMDVFSLIAIYPLISILIQPDLLNSNVLLQKLWLITGSETMNDFIIVLTAAVSLVVLGGSGLNMMAQIQANRFAAFCQERLGRELMELLLQAPYSWHLERSPLLLGSLFQNHIVIWSRDVLRRTAAMAGQLASILLPAALLIAWSPLLGVLIIIVAFIFLTFLLRFIRKKTQRLMINKKEEEERLHIFLTEVLQGIKDIKLSSREKNLINTFTHSYHVACMNFAAANNWSLFPIQIVLVSGQLGILFIGVGLFLYGMSGGILASTIAIVVLVASRVLPAMNRMGTAVNGLVNVGTWIEVLDEVYKSLKIQSYPFLEYKFPIQRLSWQMIELCDIGFVYPGTKESSLQQISLRLSRGSSYAFVGTSGAGKSTLVDLILGLLKPSSGSIEIDGRILDFDEWRKWQAGIGYVPQMPMIRDATLRENIAFGMPSHCIDNEKVMRCLLLAHFNDVLDNLPEGLDTKLGDRGVKLSGGQRQRVAIARALYNDPDILVLDEATSALDSLSERKIRDSLSDLHGKVTIISIAHRFSTIISYDRIFVMESGQVTAHGTFHELMRQSEIFRKLALESSLHINPF